MLQQISWKIGGQQGEGIESAGELFAEGLNGQGYHLYGYRVFSSRIRGGHTNYNILAGTSPIASIADRTDILIALDQETITLCAKELSAGGLILADSVFSPVFPTVSTGRFVATPFTDLAFQAGNPKMKNVVALGMTAAIVGLPPGKWEDALRKEFAQKGGSVFDENRKAFQLGSDYIKGSLPELLASFQLEAGDGRRRLYIIGNEAITQGALAAGCRFMAAYPITPASEIMEAMVHELPPVGGTMVQTEDEISACMMAIGANYAGVRAFTATSGPGLSLMAESIGLAGMTETPLVVVDVQRGGPSTGLPTKHEQSDIMAAIYSTHGEAPKIVMAPDSIAAAYQDTIEAFNLSEEFQCPVIILSDMQISLGCQTIEPFSDESASVCRGVVLSEAELPELPKNQYFKRYAATVDGISPRAIPGTKNGIHHVTGLEHDETGRPFEGISNRTAQMDKRLRKMDSVAARFPKPIRCDSSYESADLLIIGTGASMGAISEAVARLKSSGLRVNHAQVRLLHPFPTESLLPLMTATQIVVVEHNATAQLASLVQMRTFPTRTIHSVLKYDGTPFRPEEIVTGCREVL